MSNDGSEKFADGQSPIVAVLSHCREAVRRPAHSCLKATLSSSTAFKLDGCALELVGARPVGAGRVPVGGALVLVADGRGLRLMAVRHTSLDHRVTRTRQVFSGVEDDGSDEDESSEAQTALDLDLQ